MSAPAPSDGKDAERRKSLGKYVKRMSSVFRREKSSTSAPSASSAPATPSTPAVAPKTETETKGKEKPAEESAA
jgi:hypothetical protein